MTSGRSELGQRRPPRRRRPPRPRPRTPGRRRTSRAGRRARPGGRRRSAAGSGVTLPRPPARRGRSPAPAPRSPCRRRAPTRSPACRPPGSTRWRIAVSPKPAAAVAGVAVRRPRTRRRRRGRRASRRRPCTRASGRRATRRRASRRWRAPPARSAAAPTSISGWSGSGSPVVVNSTGMPLSADQRSRDVGQGLGERRALEGLGPRRLDRSPRLGQALARQPERVPDVPLAVVGPVARLLGRLELGDDPGQAVGDRVVDLAGHPLPLVEHARLAGLGHAAALQPGVLLERGLELGHRLPPLLAQLGQPLAEHRAEPDRERLDDDDRRRTGSTGRSSATGSPLMSVLIRIDVAATPATASGHGRSTEAWKNPVIMKMKNSGLREHQHRRERQQADEVDRPSAPRWSRRASATGCTSRRPSRGERDEDERDERARRAVWSGRRSAKTVEAASSTYGTQSREASLQRSHAVSADSDAGSSAPRPARLTPSGTLARLRRPRPT